jgi:HD-like signal output (HDOD) protein/CheY-like chemotaxis protein
MKRIIFVDDEVRILEGLQRMLRPQRHVWELAFAPSGQAALQMMEAAPFDVIVSDMRMPRMDGATLLKSVREKYPSVLRIILSGYTELEAALNAVPVAHQFLVKPCDQDILQTAIERATSLNSILSNKRLESIIGSMQQLPSLPKSCMEMREALADPDADSHRIARLVERDPAMSAKILQLVNSAFFGVARNVSDINMAITYLGKTILENLVLSVEIFRIFRPAKSIPGFSLESLHAHAQLTAQMAGHVATDNAMRRLGMVAGLLHDVGKLVLAEATPEHFARAIAGARNEKRPLFEIEEELTGVSHAEAGAYVLSMWGIPYVIVEAVAHHDHLERVACEKVDLLASVYFANWLAHDHEDALHGAAGIPNAPLNQEIVVKLGVENVLPKSRAEARSAALDLAGAPGGK